MAAKRTETLPEALLVPDVVKQLAEIKQSLDTVQATQILGGTTSKGSASSGVAATPSGIMRFSMPVPFEELLQIMVVAYPQDVSPLYVRDVALIPAYGHKVISEPISDGETGALVYQHVMTVDYFTPNFLITHQQDNSPPVVAAAPATQQITVLGAFLRPVQSKITHILQNDEDLDINFIDNAQIAMMSQHFVKEVWNPFMAGQVDIIKEAATAFKAVGIYGG